MPVFPDQVSGLSNRTKLVCLPGSDFGPFSRTRLRIIVLGSGFRSFFRTRSWIFPLGSGLCPFSRTRSRDLSFPAGGRSCEVFSAIVGKNVNK